MEERMAEPAEEVAQQPENEDSDGEEGGRMFAWVVNDNMEEDDEEEEEEEEEEEDVDVEDEQPLDTEASESFELDAPAERSGHIAVVYENIMYLWGGYKNSRIHGFFDLYLPRNEIWTYNMVSGAWTKHVAGGNLQTSMSGSCAVCVDGVLYLFGGHHARGNTNRIYRLPLRASSFVWEEMKDLKGLSPSCKDKLGCWVYKNRLIFFGGYGYAAQGPHRGTYEYDELSSFGGDSPGRGWNNHVHILDLETSTWSQPVTTGNRPLPRAAHACATVGNRGYVFGGRYKDYRLNDLYYINLDTWEWHDISVPQHGPVGRSWHSFTPVSSDHIFLFGGFTTERETLSDAWLYCVSKNEWKPFKHNHTQRPRLWHTACFGPEGEVFVFGGCANNLLSQHRAEHSSELLVFNVQPKSLFRLCTEAILQHRDCLSRHWDCLPKHLLHGLKRRMASANTLGS
ncbi:kelch domain-containing protein 2 isoform X2 [Nelusetta ayraudi]|uniref:kelch domain-containing protein 2 isoform X2 n=1 Tax=Nelusetta ayraudi TaxID=303726 RepID=UPI003F708A38